MKNAFLASLIFIFGSLVCAEEVTFQVGYNSNVHWDGRRPEEISYEKIIKADLSGKNNLYLEMLPCKVYISQYEESGIRVLEANIDLAAWNVRDCKASGEGLLAIGSNYKTVRVFGSYGGNGSCMCSIKIVPTPSN